MNDSYFIQELLKEQDNTAVKDFYISVISLPGFFFQFVSFSKTTYLLIVRRF
jgi:hypothetical protein